MTIIPGRAHLLVRANPESQYVYLDHIPGSRSAEPTAPPNELLLRANGSNSRANLAVSAARLPVVYQDDRRSTLAAHVAPGLWELVQWVVKDVSFGRKSDRRGPKLI